MYMVNAPTLSLTIGLTTQNLLPSYTSDMQGPSKKKLMWIKKKQCSFGINQTSTYRKLTHWKVISLIKSRRISKRS